MRFLELKVPPVALFLIVAALMWLVARAVPGAAFPLPARQPIAWVLAAAGVAVAVAGVWSFRRARTTVNPHSVERVSALVTSGIFRRTRNPMYLGLLFVLAGWAAHRANALALVFLPVFVAYLNRFQIVPEERVLAAKFGPEFAAYAARVRRWL